MKLDKKAVAKLEMPEGKSDHIVFDDDLPGFGVRLRAGGKRTWIVQYRQGNKQRRITLGRVAGLDCDKAREAAKVRLAHVTLGDDPQAKKLAERARAHLTVGALIESYLAGRAKGVERGELRPRTHEESERYLLKHWRPLHPHRIDKLSRSDVAGCLNRIRRDSGEVAAARAHSALSGFYVWAMGEGHVESNPVIGTNKPTEPAARDRVLTGAEIAEIWAACQPRSETLHPRRDNSDYRRIVRLLLLTGCRRDEIGALRWSEVDRTDAAIRLPSERTKNGRPHTVPLSPLALAVLAEVKHQGERDCVFGLGDDGFSGWSAAKERLDARIVAARREVNKKAKPMPEWVIHDLRRTCSTGMGDLGVQRHVIEALLNHVSGHRAGVAGVYNRSPYANECRTALVLWADHVRAIVEGAERRVLQFTARH
jgi:integrase